MVKIPKVLHLSSFSSDSVGNVVRLLDSTLNSRGNVSSAVIFGRESNIRSDPKSNISLTSAAIVDEMLLKRRDFSFPISLIRSKLEVENLEDQIWKLSPDILHLHWVEGLISDSSLLTLSSAIPTVWTLHDMRPVTGACHQMVTCAQDTNCSSCPAVRQPLRPLVFRSRQKRLSTVQKCALVIPSESFKLRLNKSAQRVDLDERVIHHGLDRSAFSVVHSKKRDIDFLIVGSTYRARFKGIEEIYQSLRKQYPDSVTLTVGSSELEGGEHLGVVSRQTFLNTAARAKVIISPSSAESFSMTTAEATSLGTPTASWLGSPQLEIANMRGLGIDLEAMLRVGAGYSFPEPLGFGIPPRLSAKSMSQAYEQLYFSILK